MMGRYAPVARLGTGGMADVFLTLAHGPQGVNKLAVVKRLRDPGNVAFIEMLLDEARLAARLNHPNIVHTYEAGEARGEYFIAMEYLEGQTLSRLLKETGGLSEPFVAFVALQVLKGLDYAHGFCDFDGTPLEVVHRDVSPNNLFVTYGGEIKLLDFGIAKAAVNVAHTVDGALKGKVRYMAPEQATGSDVDRRADIFAFGIVLWEMLAKKPLFSGAPLSILTRLVGEEIPPVRTVRPDVSPALEAIALKAVRRDRSQRYATADEMRVDLEAYLRGRTDAVSERDVARVMNDLFATTRDEVKAQIKAYTSSVSARGTFPSAPGVTGTGSLPILPGWSLPPSSHSIPPPPPPEEAVVTTGPVVSARRRRSVLPIAAGVTIVALGLGLFESRVVLRPGAAAPVLAAPSPAAPAADAPAKRARIHLVTTPPGARAEWNGVTFGPTPTDIAIDPGPQSVRLFQEAYEPAMIRVDLKPGEDVSRAVTLIAIRAESQIAAPAPEVTPRPAPAPASGHATHVTHAAPQAAPPPPAAPAPVGSTPRAKIRVIDETDGD
jgi:serine/threonine protein kinase